MIFTITYLQQTMFTAVLWLRYMAHVMLFPTFNVLYFYITTFIRKYAVPNVAVSSSSLMYFPGKLLRYFLNDSEMAPLAPIVTGNICVFVFLPRCIFIVLPLYFRIHPSPGISMSIIIIIIILI